MTILGPARTQPVAGESLTELLRQHAARVLREKDKRPASIARDAWLDDSYVSKLLSGDRCNPSRDALILLGSWGLELSVEETDELLLAGDYKPLVLPATLRLK